MSATAHMRQVCFQGLRRERIELCVDVLLRAAQSTWVGLDGCRRCVVTVIEVRQLIFVAAYRLSFRRERKSHRIGLGTHVHHAVLHDLHIDLTGLFLPGRE